MRREQRIGGVGVFGEVDPSLGGVDGAMTPAGLDAGRDGEARYGVADHLALAAAEAADGVAHEENLAEVFSAEGGPAKVLSGAELALDGDAVVGIEAEIGSLVGRLTSFSAGAAGFEIAL